MGDWRRVPLGDVFEVQLGKMLSAGSEHGDQFPYLANRNVQWGQIVIDQLGTMNFSAVERERYRLKSGDLLVCEGGEVGRAALWSDQLPECYFQNALHRLRATPVAEARFMRHYIEFAALTGSLRALTGQTSIGHLPRSNLVRWRVPIPPLDEQRRIAEILDTIDETIQSTERIVEKLKRARHGVRESLFRPNGSDCRTRRLADLVEAIVDCPHSTPEYRSSGVLVARTMHIKNGRFLVNDASRVSEAAYRQRVMRLIPRAGDVVLTREAPVGEAFMIPEAMRICLGQRVVLIRSGRNLFGQYLVELIYSSQGRRQIRRLLAGTTNPHLNVDEIRKLEFAIPSLGEQSRALDSFNAINTRLDTEDERLEKLRRIRSGLATDLLSGRVRTVAA